MKMNAHCLPCLINQVIKTAEMTEAPQKEKLYRQVFEMMSQMDFNQTNPEIIGATFRLLKKHIGCEDPYKNLRLHYNTLFLNKMAYFDQQIETFEQAIKYAIIANIIDFNPIHQNVQQDVSHYFNNIQQLTLTIDHVQNLKNDLMHAKTLLYLGDNCGEICLDRLLIQRIKQLNPQLSVFFGVRGAPVVNDNIEEDAYFVGMDKEAHIISNGDDSLGTILKRTSLAFQEIYHQADVVIAKGQANYESLSEENKNIYFLLMVKCAVIAQYIQVPEKSLVCLKQNIMN